MARWQSVVLVDTNVIIEAFRAGAWKALAGGYPLETVEACVIETQTGHQNRRREQQIDLPDLEKGLKAVHRVEKKHEAAALILDEEIAKLDEGERHLWSHAITRKDAWLLCGPDKASLRIGLRLGHRERLVSLENLLTDVGFKPKQPLKSPYRKDWLTRVLAELAQREGKIA